MQRVGLSGSHQAAGRVLVKAVSGLIVSSALLALFFFWRGFSLGGTDSPDEAAEVYVHNIKRADFVSIVTESGDLESGSNVEVRCEVESVGAGGGTTLLKIVEEGTLVHEGDFLAQFDDAALQQALTQQEIVVATDHAAVIESRSELDKAKRALKEYEQGTFLSEKETLESARLQAEIHLQSSAESLEHSSRMYRKGYISAAQLRTEEKSVEMARKAVEVAQINLKVLQRFTFDKMVGEFKADIEKQGAYLAAAQFTEKLSQQRRDELLDQINNCRVVAPAAGQVIYANDYQKRDAVVIEEGGQIREGQVIIYLPDPRQMQVDMRISDSKINMLRVGNEANIVLDVDPQLPVRGELAEIAPFPYPRSWKGAPIEYGATVRIVDPPSRLRPGQRAKVHIHVERREDVVQTPIQSVVGREDNHYCLLKDARGEWNVRQVVVGPSNDSHVVVKNGLKVGDRVALNPDLLWDDVAQNLPPAAKERRMRVSGKNLQKPRKKKARSAPGPQTIGD